MSRVRVVHPEFGYAGNSNFFRPFMVFGACGLVAGAIGFAVFDPAPDADPMDAMALAPPEALSAPKFVAPVAQSETGPANRPSAQKSDGERARASRNAGSVKPACRDNPGEAGQGDCSPVHVIRMRPPRAVNERPLIAAVPIGHRDDPTMIPEEPKAPAAPTQVSVANEIPSDAAAAAEPAPPASLPTVTNKKSRPRVHHASSRRNQYSYGSSDRARVSGYSASRAYVQFGYARLW